MSEANIAAIQSLMMEPAQFIERLASINPAAQKPEISFGEMLRSGIASVNQQVTQANSVAAAFALDDSIPPHQVMVQLEQAKLSMQLMMQVRARLVEGYQEFMRMQL